MATSRKISGTRSGSGGATRTTMVSPGFTKGGRISGSSNG